MWALVCRARSAARSQQPAAADAGEPTRIVLEVTRVNMLFTVTDKKGRFITDLGKDDFEVIENKKPQDILGVHGRNATCLCALPS